MADFWVMKQAPVVVTKPEPPAFVHRATRSPTFGVRVFEQVGKFPTAAAAKKWMAENQPPGAAND